MIHIVFWSIIGGFIIGSYIYHITKQNDLDFYESAYLLSIYALTVVMLITTLVRLYA